MRTTYYKPFLRGVIYTGGDTRNAILHAKFNSLTAITGRFSSSKPNLQNIPRILGPRQCFRPRPGFVNYHLDYSQVEMRLYIHYAKDAKLKAALLAGKDLHLQTAAEIFDKPESVITKEERKKAKSTNFGILYGSGAETLSITLTKMGIPTTKAEAARYLERYHKAKPSCRRLMNKCKAELLRRGYVENEFGRRFRVPMKLSYKALNALIQGCSADIMKRAMVRIWKFLKKEKCRSAIIMTIHDEIVIEVHESEEKWLIPILKRLMEKDAPKFWVPITCDIERTWTYWSEKHSKGVSCFVKKCDDCSGSWGSGPSWSFPCGCKCHEKKGVANA
jgi:DNA polymerase-1